MLYRSFAWGNNRAWFNNGELLGKAFAYTDAGSVVQLDGRSHPKWPKRWVIMRLRNIDFDKYEVLILSDDRRCKYVGFRNGSAQFVDLFLVSREGEGQALTVDFDTL